MKTTNRKSRYLLITVLSGALMMSGSVLAEESESMVPAPGLAFGLQSQVQNMLNTQIEQATSGALIDHQLTQEIKQLPAVTTDCTEKKSKSVLPG